MKPTSRQCKLYCTHYTTCTKKECNRKLTFDKYSMYMAEPKEYVTLDKRMNNKIRNGVIPMNLNAFAFVSTGMARKRGIWWYANWSHGITVT